MNDGSCKHGPGEGWFGKYCSSPKQGLGAGGGRAALARVLTWLSEVTRCCTVWPSAVVISWM